MPVNGVLHVYSAPAEICADIDWMVAGVIGAPGPLPWSRQPADPGSRRCEFSFTARPGAAAAIASALRGSGLRFEVTEEASLGCDGVRFSVTPQLGLFAASTAANGDIVVREGELKIAMAEAAAGGSLAAALARLLGEPWDTELEPFRQASCDLPGTPSASPSWRPAEPRPSGRRLL